MLPRSGSPGVEHVKRVYQVCLIIGKALEADLETLLSAAILHDIGRTGSRASHAKESTRISKKLLLNTGHSISKIKMIFDAIVSHSYEGAEAPKTLEAKILSDADKLHTLGSVGIYRAAAHAAEEGRSIRDLVNHFHEKLLQLPELMYTQTARDMAFRRKVFMVKYLDKLEQELRFQA